MDMSDFFQILNYWSKNKYLSTKLRKEENIFYISLYFRWKNWNVINKKMYKVYVLLRVF